MIRNAKFNAVGSIDCEIEHPVYGWIPFTASATDVEQHGRDIYAQALELNPTPYAAPAPDPVGDLERERANMVCSRLQGRLVLGEETCAAIDALAADPATPWAMRETISNAIEWRRTSQAMTELGYLLGYVDLQMDELFRVAMTVEV